MEILTLAIVGAIASSIVGFIKTKHGIRGYKSVTALVVVSMIGGLGYYFVERAGFLEASATVLIVANTIYTLLYKPFMAPAIK